MRIAIAWIAALGLLLFGAGLLASYANPLLVEALARELIKQEIQQRVGDKLAALDDSAVLQLAARASEKYAAEIAAIRHRLRPRLAALIDSVAIEMSDPACPCRKIVFGENTEQLRGRLSELLQQNERLTGLVRSKYREVAAALTREWRIFCVANALMFLLLGLCLRLRRAARLQLLLPAAVLLATTVLVGFFYLFRQDWLHAIVFGDYVGLGYFVYLGLVGGFLADILLNRARISTRIVNLLLQLIGSAASAVPC
ncbi:hypothetical protein DFR29_102433 [Tahibacter aquaticus]|uniref:Uncharacterized protein n=1 Tax=Tahibacter aquaticus TaxID=520092 RepID=A0A4R6Z7J7_9GAMM|nr:hypothetical protein [Tahibacter aquaticus]TDR47771.1 hypothetical protein DFR29_102433 [Tahibacter aquaticus]